MTNYKRFISYLYYYEIGQKKGNIGFARVESSDELCKVTVHCALKTISKRPCTVVLLRRQTSLIISEEVGVAEVKDGLLDVKLSFERGIIKPDDFNFKDCIGIVLLYSKDSYIGAKWDESSVTYHEASLIEQAIRTAKNKAEDQKLEEERNLRKEQQEAQKPLDIIVEKEPSIYVIPSEEVQVIDLESRRQEAEAARTSEEQKNSDIKQDTNECMEEELTNVPEEELEENVAEQSNDEADPDELVTAAGGSAAAAVNMSQWIDHPAARSILNRFVRMYPFDDGEIAECVRLEPKDIGLLPMTSWPLGNNSFLLHSYCNFRHLLFSKKLTREGCEYYLMVPGTLNPREKQLAKMFGFENFKCSRRRCMRDGEFGYWYIEIVFN